MPIRVSLAKSLRPNANGAASIDCEADTVEKVLTELAARFPSLRARILDDDRLRRSVLVYRNDEDIRALDDVRTTLRDGDELSIVVALAGG